MQRSSAPLLHAPGKNKRGELALNHDDLVAALQTQPVGDGGGGISDVGEQREPLRRVTGHAGEPALDLIERVVMLREGEIWALSLRDLVGDCGNGAGWIRRLIGVIEIGPFSCDWKLGFT